MSILLIGLILGLIAVICGFTYIYRDKVKFFWNKHKMKILGLAATSAILGSGFIIYDDTPLATTWYVDDSGGQDYTTIQAAINAASNGDTIYVYGGTYNENINISKQLTITGQLSDIPIIDGGDSGDAIYVTDNNVSISNFKIRDAEYGIHAQEGVSEISQIAYIDSYMDDIACTGTDPVYIYGIVAITYSVLTGREFIYEWDPSAEEYTYLYYDGTTKWIHQVESYGDIAYYGGWSGDYEPGIRAVKWNESSEDIDVIDSLTGSQCCMFDIDEDGDFIYGTSSGTSVSLQAFYIGDGGITANATWGADTSWGALEQDDIIYVMISDATDLRALTYNRTADEFTLLDGISVPYYADDQTCLTHDGTYLYVGTREGGISAFTFNESGNQTFRRAGFLSHDDFPNRYGLASILISDGLLWLTGPKVSCWDFDGANFHLVDVFQPVGYVSDSFDSDLEKDDNGVIHHCDEYGSLTALELYVNNGWTCDNLTIDNVEVYNCDVGIRTGAHYENTIDSVTINDSYIHDCNNQGISISRSNNVEVTNCIITSSEIGLTLDSTNNTAYNNFFSNTVNAVDPHKDTVWNITKTAGTNIADGDYLGGNYWSDYYGGDSDGDTIGDTPYNISTPFGVTQDELPLINLRDLYVDDDAASDWYDLTHVHTIQEALDNSSSIGNVSIYVYNGTYNEYNLTINKSCNIIGNSSTGVTVNGQGNFCVFNLSSDDTNISGLKITNADYGIYTEGYTLDGMVTGFSAGDMTNSSDYIYVINGKKLKQYYEGNLTYYTEVDLTSSLSSNLDCLVYDADNDLVHTFASSDEDAFRLDGDNVSIIDGHSTTCSEFDHYLGCTVANSKVWMCGYELSDEYDSKKIFCVNSNDYSSQLETGYVGDIWVQEITNDPSTEYYIYAATWGNIHNIKKLNTSTRAIVATSDEFLPASMAITDLIADDTYVYATHSKYDVTKYRKSDLVKMATSPPLAYNVNNRYTTGIEVDDNYVYVGMYYWGVSVLSKTDLSIVKTIDLSNYCDYVYDLLYTNESLYISTNNGVIRLTDLGTTYLDNITIENCEIDNCNEYAIYLGAAVNSTIYGCYINDSINGLLVGGTSNNLVYNNFFYNNTGANAIGGDISWNISKTSGTNIVGGAYLGGNYWDDYIGTDTDEDGIGNTLLPHNSSGYIIGGGDYLPLLYAVNTSIDDISPYWQDQIGSILLTVNTTGGLPQNVSLWYRWSPDNVSWASNDSIWNVIEDAVDSNSSNVDSTSDMGTEENFTYAVGTTSDGNPMTISEVSVGVANNNDSVDGNESDIDSSPDVGIELNFTYAQGNTTDNNNMSIQEYSTTSFDYIETNVTTNTSDIDSSPDVGYEANFSNCINNSINGSVMTISEVLDSDLTNYNDTIDYNTSNIDGVSDDGTESGFDNSKGTTVDNLNMTISEYSDSPSDINDSVDSSSSNVDSSEDIGTETNFSNAQDNTTDSNDMVIQEVNIEPVFYNPVDNNTADKDASADVGTETSFSNCQSNTTDSSTMTLEEHDITAISSIQEDLDVDGFTGDTSTWSPVGDSPYLDADDSVNTISGNSNGQEASWFTFTNASYDSGNYTVTLYVDFDAGDGDDDCNWYIDVDNDGTGDFSGTFDNPTTSTYSVVVTGLDNVTEINNARLRLVYDKSGGGGVMTVDYAYLNISSDDVVVENYDLDMEYQFDNCNTTENYAKLHVYLTDSVNENINVYYYDLGWIYIGSITSTGWNNITLLAIQSSTYNIRFVSEDRTVDGVNDTWNIDSMKLSTYNKTCQLDLEYQFTGVNYSDVNEELCIYVSDTETGEPEGFLEFGYRKRINITNNIEAYQTRIVVGYSSGGDINCSGHINSNFSDIRFVSLSTSNSIPYWIEKKEDSNYSIVWINNTYNDTSIYMYYGNENALSESNIETTWDFVNDWTSNLTSEFSLYESNSRTRYQYVTLPSSVQTPPIKMYRSMNIYDMNVYDYCGWAGVGVGDDMTYGSETWAYDMQFADSSYGATEGVDYDYRCVSEVDNVGTGADYVNPPYTQEYEKILTTFNDSTVASWLFEDDGETLIDNVSVHSNIVPHMTYFAYMYNRQDTAGYYLWYYDDANDCIKFGGARWSDTGYIYEAVKWVVIGKYVNDSQTEPSLEFSTNEESLYPALQILDAINVSYWNGTSWNYIGNITSTGWNNFTAAGLNSSTYTIRFNDNITTDDPYTSSWDIDCIYLHTWNVTNYTIDFEYNWTTSLYNADNEKINIYVNYTTGNENLLVYYWNGSAWQSLTTITTAGLYSINATGLNSSNYYIKFDGSSESGDTTADSWDIDYISINSWNDTNYEMDLEYQFTDIPDRTLQELRLYIGETPSIGEEEEEEEEEEGQYANLTGWYYRVNITINSSQVPSTISNFPVCINVSDTKFIDKVRSDGYDILFMPSDTNWSSDTNQSKYAHEIEYVDSSSGTIIAWVNIPSISSSVDTYIHMYYGKSTSSDQQNISGTWDSDFVAVYHMNSTSSMKDSTSNNNDVIDIIGDPTSTTSEELVGYNVHFDGSDGLEIADSSSLSALNRITVEYWANDNGTGSLSTIIAKKDSSGGYDGEWEVRYNPGSYIILGSLLDGTDASLEISGTEYTSMAEGWNYLAMTYDDEGVPSGIDVWLDGDELGGGGGSSGTWNDIQDTTDPVYIANTNSSNYFNGSLDEIRISKIHRSTNYLIVTYNTITNATDGGFFSIGPLYNNGTLAELSTKLELDYWNGSAWVYVDDIIFTGWNSISLPYTGLDNYTIRIRDTNSSDDLTNNTYYIDCMYINGSNDTNYKIDLEYNWSNANYSDNYAELCTYITNTSSSFEEINVEYWNSTSSSWKSLYDITTSGWSNYTFSADHITSKDFYIRLTSDSVGSDIVQDSWDVDCIYLYTWNISEYDIDFEYQFTSIETDNNVNRLMIDVDSITGSEELKIYDWDSSWHYLGSITGTGLKNISATGVPSSGGTYTIRFVGDNLTGDTSEQGSWDIDYIYVYSYNDEDNPNCGSDWLEWNDSNNPDFTFPFTYQFNFPNGTAYYEFYSIGKNSEGDESPPGSADAICHVNATGVIVTPTISNEYPYSGTNDIEVQPTCSIGIYLDNTTASADVTFATNASGSWENKDTYEVTQGQIEWAFTEASSYNTTYYWKVYALSTSGTNVSSSVYNFTTIEQDVAPTITNESPTNGSTDDISIQPTCRAQFNDGNSKDRLDITFASNYSSSWVNYKTFPKRVPGSHCEWQFEGMTAYNTTYYWRVYCDDGNTNVSEIYHFTTQSTSVNTTIRNDGIDYFIWLGNNGSAWNVSQVITGWNDSSDYIAIWNNGTWSNTDANWDYYYGDESGTNFSISTFDVVMTYINTSGDTQLVWMTKNMSLQYNNSKVYRLVNTTVNKGYNYTGYNRNIDTNLSEIEDKITLQVGESLALWNETNYVWDWFIPGFYEPDVIVHRWDVILTKVENTEIWNT